MMTRLLASLILVLTSAPVLAQNWYQVNLVVFENRSAITGDETLTQPDGVQFERPDIAVEIDSIPESGDENGFQRTTIIDQEFNSVVASLQRSSGYKVLMVKSWRQPGLERSKAIPVIIRGGDTFGQHSRVEGSVRLVLSRYLHLETDLWLGDYTQQLATPQEWTEEPGETATTTSLIPAEEPETATPAILFEPTRLIRMQESRRMRSKELHYLDHPMLGVVAKVIPLQGSQQQ